MNFGGLQYLRPSTQAAPGPQMANAAASTPAERLAQALQSQRDRQLRAEGQDPANWRRYEQFGGGGGSGQETPTPTEPQFRQIGGYNDPTYPVPRQIVQPGMPGQIDQIAQQLGMGGYGNPADLQAHMGQFYKPMSMPNYGATPIPPPDPSAPPAETPAPQQPQRQNPVMGGGGLSALVNRYNPRGGR